jgi:hypothetical protein
MKSLKNLWAWFVGLFNREKFEEVVIPEEPPPAKPEPVEEPKEEPAPTLPEDFIFSCADGTPVPPEYYANASRLAANLRRLSQELGEPLSLISVYRTPAYNKAVGGKADSAHLCCMAADFLAVEQEHAAVVNKIAELMAAGGMTAGKVVLNPSFVHYEMTKVD